MVESRNKINGFSIMATKTKINNGNNNFEIFVVVKSIPKDTKNMVAKKSFSGLTLPIISTLYGKEARLTPAIKAPIAIENPKECANKANKKHIVKADNNKSSFDLAANLKM